MKKQHYQTIILGWQTVVLNSHGSEAWLLRFVARIFRRHMLENIHSIFATMFCSNPMEIRRFNSLVELLHLVVQLLESERKRRAANERCDGIATKMDHWYAWTLPSFLNHGIPFGESKQ
jgi:hypothetical protein